MKKLIHSAMGKTILDFGGITGWVRFRCHVPEGQKVTLQYSEMMQDGKFYRENLRTAAAEFSFIFAGDDRVIRPHFTFYGFRYVKVTGMEVTEKNLGDLEAWCLYSELEETGHIETSNEKVNQLIQNTK
ncbi:MAG: family 78 glycoside hydrolase catalytic domain [Lachnospiraceae bacterium]